jgi:hypothetical protein
MEEQDQKRHFPWKRYWVPQGQDPVTRQGYFVEPGLEDLFWSAPKTNAAPLSALKDIPCLVLLGDMGMGKSTVVREGATELSKGVIGQKHAVVFQDLKRLTEEQIYRRVFGDPDVEAWTRGEQSLTLFLDSLDECWRRIDELEAVLVGELESRTGRRKERKEDVGLFLRLTCRAAEWRGHVGAELRRLFSSSENEKGSVQMFTLAPLSENNVRQAAELEGCDPEDLLRRIAEKDAQPLASHPITLDMLLQIFRQGHELTGSRVDLYERGCLELCADRQTVPGSRYQNATTPAQRLAIASRLAVLSVLTNRYLINGNPERPLARPDVLEAAQAFGYFEEEVGGETVRADKATIIDALRTALFAEPIEGLQTWRHQSYAEFLAAMYLARRGIPPDRIVALITDTTDNAGRLIPQLEETARWVADRDPAVFELLVSGNAEVFVRCDPKNLDNRKREMLVSGYLDLIRRHHAPELDWQLKSRLARLGHAGLTGQLSGVIGNRREDPLVRASAIDIAGYCKCTGLAAQLVDVFLDPVDVFRVRQRAGFALEQLADKEVRDLLKARARPENIDDPMDELRGYYLKILWPSHLSSSDLLSLLTAPKSRGYTGSYRSFLFDLARDLPDSDLPQVLDWLREGKINFDILGPFGHFPEAIASRAFGKMRDPRIRDAVAGLVRSLGSDLHHLFGGGSRDCEASPTARREFWVGVLEAEVDIHVLVSFGDLVRGGLLRAEDLGFFCSQYRAAIGDKRRAGWRQLLFSVFDPADLGALDQLSDLASTDPSVAEILTARTSSRVMPDAQNWPKRYLREQREEEARRVTQPAPSFTDAVEGHLRAFEQGTAPAFWWVINDALQMDPDKFPYQGSVFPTIRLTEGRAWRSLSLETKRRIVAAAGRYVEVQPVDEEQAWDEERCFQPYDGLYPLLVLLFEESREVLTDLPAPVWVKWAPVLITYYGRQNGAHEEALACITSLAFQHAKAEWLGALRRFLDRYVNHDHKRSIIWRLGSVWSPEIKDILIDVLRRKPLKDTAGQDLLQLLYSHEPSEALALTREIFESRQHPEACSVLVPVAGAALITSLPEGLGSEIIGILKSEPALGRRICWCLLGASRRAPNWLSRLRPKANAELWDWLDTQFPGNPYERDDVEGRVTPLHEMHLLHVAVLQSLINRASLEACAAMGWLMWKRPKDFWLGDSLATMRKAARGTAWARPGPVGLMRSFEDARKRLVQTAGDLQAIVLESLRRFEGTLHRSPPSLELWNEVVTGRKTTWDPKHEPNLSSCLKRHIERDLDEFGIIANREVQLRPRLGPESAELVDILVHAVPFDEGGKAGKPVAVVVEVKCAWNDGVLHDMDRQLYGRYLASNEFAFGIYVVAYFTCEAWNRPDDWRRGRAASGMDIGELDAKLQAQARRLSSCEKRIDALVLDARIGDAAVRPPGLSSK